MLTPYRAGILHEPEMWSAEERGERTFTALRDQLASIEMRSPFHRARFAAAGFDPAAMTSADDIRRLPLMRKPDHQESLAAAEPWGTQLAVEPADVVRVHFSSGTTGVPPPGPRTP